MKLIRYTVSKNTCLSAGWSTLCSVWGRPLTACRAHSCSSEGTAARGSSRCCSCSALRCRGRKASSRPEGREGEPHVQLDDHRPMAGDPVVGQTRWSLTTGKVARPTPEGPSTQHSSERYLRADHSAFPKKLMQGVGCMKININSCICIQ